MKLHKLLTPLVLAFSFFACTKTHKFELQAPNKIQINQSLSFKINLDTENLKVVYFLDGKKTENNAIDISSYKLGTHTLAVVVGEQNDTVRKEKKILFLNSTKPKIYTYKVINSYPHDESSFTQGLEFYKNELYEGTGQRGQSLLRKVDLETGKVLKEQALASKYFGEGITIFNKQIYQLTWQSKIGFIYDVDTFKTLKTFNYQASKEGWGLTHNNTHLIKSDGTEKIWFLDPKSTQETSHIEVYTNKRRVENLNELEYFNDRIYANVWTKNAIAIINPKNGALEALVNMKGLAKYLDNKTTINSDSKVLNGIAYNATTQKLYVTGKYWDKIFEIEIVK